VTVVRFTRRTILEEIAATLVMAATVLGYITTHEQWNVWLIGDSRRWTTGLLCVLAALMFALVARHIGATAIAVSAVVAVMLAWLAVWTASLTWLSLLALTIVLVWAAAVLRDLFAAPHAPMAT
jgi:hypothetical protein